MDNKPSQILSAAMQKIFPIKHYVAHLDSCESGMTEVCTCGLRGTYAGCIEAVKQIKETIAKLEEAERKDIPFT